MYIFASISKYKWKIKILRMKKLYSFLASSLVAVGVNAAMPAKVAADKVSSVAQGDITNVIPLKVNMTKAEGMQVKKHTSVNPLIFKEKKGASKVNKVLPDDGYNWETLGEADFYDAITVAPLAELGAPAQNFKVEIQESQSQKGIYRLVNIHANNPNVGEDVGLQIKDPEVESYMIFNTLDGGPIIQETVYNLLDPFDYENEYIVSQTNFGTFNDGVAILPAGAIAVGLGIEPFDVLEFDEDYNPIVPADYAEKVFMTSEDLVIVLPGATYDPGVQESDYSFEMYQDYLCAKDNNEARFAFVGGDDIVEYKYGIYSGKFEISNANLDIVAEKGISGLDSGYWYPFVINKQGWCTVFVVGLNAAGERVAGGGKYFYFYAHNPEEWNSIGHVMFTDDTFGPIYGEDGELKPIKVEALESKTKSGLYRLVNPYATHELVEKYAGMIECHSSHSHYLDIDASDIENVVITDAPIGISVGTEHIALANFEPGTLVDNKITFPKNGLAVGFFGGEADGYMDGNKNGRFAVELPCTLKVHALDAEGNPVDGAVVYAGETEGVTDANGDADVELFGVIGTKVYVTVSKDYMFWEGEADFTEGNTAYVNAELVEPDCTLTVRAFAGSEDEPVAVAEGDIYVNGQLMGKTDENGGAVITLEGVIGTTVSVAVMKDGLCGEYEADFTEGEQTWAMVMVTNPAHVITATITNKDNEPVEEAFVNAQNKSYITNDKGITTIILGEIAEDNIVKLSAYKGYGYGEAQVDLTGKTEAAVAIVLEEPACTLKVSVCDAEGEPVEGATVYVNGTEEITPENGTVAFTLEGVMGTKVAVSAYKDYMFWEGEADFTESQEAWIIAELKEPACTLTVKAINADYEPIAGAIVNVKGEEKETDETGTAVFTLEGVMGTKVAVSAYKDYMFWEGEADFTEGSEAWVFAELKNPDCTLSVKVVDADYEPVADAIVIANGVEATTAENGSANLEVGDVLGTVITVKVTKDGYKDAEVEADFTETMEANIMVTLTKSTTVGLSLAIIDANKNIKVYDLQGRRVEHPTVGNIYIVDGKKVRILE